MQQCFISEQWPVFFTATIQHWKFLLHPDDHKLIIIDSLRFLVKQRRIYLYGFVIMSNHIHLIWQPLCHFTHEQVRSSFLKFTARQLLISATKQSFSDEYAVNLRDRKYQIWKRDSLGKEISGSRFFQQKLNYIHQNPVRSGLCVLPEDYWFSSARYYITGVDDFDMIMHFQQ